MRDVGQGPEVRDVEARVPDALDVERLRPLVDGALEGGGVVALHEPHVDAEAGQRDLELVVGPAVEVAGGDDVVAGLGEGGEGQELRGLPAGRGQRGRPALERGHPLLEDVGGRVHDPRVDVPELLKREQARTVGGVVEGERRALVDGHGAGVRARGGLLPGVDLQRLVAVAGRRLRSSVVLRGGETAAGEGRGRRGKEKTRFGSAVAGLSGSVARCVVYRASPRAPRPACACNNTCTSRLAWWRWSRTWTSSALDGRHGGSGCQRQSWV